LLTAAFLAAVTEQVHGRVIGSSMRQGFLDSQAAAGMLPWVYRGVSIAVSVCVALLDRDVPKYFQGLDHLLQ
jgi:hypothetical protein